MNMGHAAIQFVPDYIMNLLGWIEIHPGTAAWVQAVSTIVALAIAIRVPQASDRRSRRRFLSSVASICDEVRDCFVNASERCSADPDEGLEFVRSVQAFHRFRIVSSSVHAIPLHELPTYDATRSVLELQAMMAEALMQLDTAFKEIEDNQRLIQAQAYGEAFGKVAHRALPYLTRIHTALSDV